MIKHFCDICKNETPQRIRVNVKAREVCGEGYFRTVGEKLMDIDLDCCIECYNTLVDIVDAIPQEESSSIFNKLGGKK